MKVGGSGVARPADPADDLFLPNLLSNGYRVGVKMGVDRLVSSRVLQYYHLAVPAVVSGENDFTICCGHYGCAFGRQDIDALMGPRLAPSGPEGGSDFPPLRT